MRTAGRCTSTACSIVSPFQAALIVGFASHGDTCPIIGPVFVFSRSRQGGLNFNDQFIILAPHAIHGRYGGRQISQSCKVRSKAKKGYFSFTEPFPSRKKRNRKRADQIPALANLKVFKTRHTCQPSGNLHCLLLQ